ncbi:tRNA (N6-isopentenyl adenosine(37)-C2)-methylthiotransferase MiaB [Niastella koreensis]|uniref:tRNA-2-methylthio-N(6)-dimethylallyladenosine synthase n=2 Tax=Niastella koreensis TaxID=354356 RepID=G8TJ50_NIAKG|nr:tRNA (N6-isopentenyl adenosine(37)-C2)-methylthiotransferase MiaB [Niastella koreensis]AEV97567.1 tRNA-i(6)A37 thiotransferase enzyme MiaB [Niastella koreensis GR20-10]OQP47622.1 tRNA (N6-isopentenyl adenosine(37)-C2)-methylthiotransferase MiaB [Niastella koreensis]
MLERMNHTMHEETRQGEAYSPFVNDPVAYVKKFYIESYGCAMNFADSEIVASILNENGFGATRNFEEADLILINTCSIREKAEQTVRKRLTELRKAKRHNSGALIGVLGCMAERLKEKLLQEEKLVDMVVGPDAYRSLPGLIMEAGTGQKAVNVLLSRDETYADIAPVRLDSNGVSGFVSIMRGCNNMCAFCVVPFTRGRERSRDPHSIIRECTDLFNQGYREVTLLGQNVDSYYWVPENSNGAQINGVSANSLPTNREGRGEAAVTFANLLEMVALIDPLLRIRFSTSHPKDITDDVLFTMAKYENICKYIHLPVQSGSTRVLQLMNRTYTREWYMAKVDRIMEIMPDCGISSDIITGFCTETEEDHQDTLSIMRHSKYDMSYMFFYSERPGTLAARRYKDDVPEDVKKRRLDEVVKLQNAMSHESNLRDLGKTFKVLIEGNSKRSDQDWMGRSSQNKVIVFPKEQYQLNKGQYVMVKVTDCTVATLIGKIEP